MNRFRTKKKVKEEAAASTGRASSDEQHSFMGFRRKQKAPEEEKPQIDITNVLPPSDDFRTSLLMTGLSARFSMLREQDDPNTKIGKALDDSVLYPKRQSKLMDFGFRGLDDIAEVESIRAPAPFMRTNSFASDTDSLQDSIMNRTRPTDGNNLFGGRQKIYRIPAGGVSSKNIAEGGMGGRALYENDVALSAFQKLRQEKKERFLDLDDDSQDASAPGNGQALLSTDTYDHASYQRSESPSPIEYSLRRETSSTTSSGARNSTAATSVASQPGTASKDWQSPQFQSSSSQAGSGTGATTPSGTTVERMPTSRIRRLYEQGLNQDLHEQQSSALSRIDTLTGKRMLRSRTPDLSASAAPSPTTGFGFGDRMNSTGGGSTVSSTLERLERRQALAKASAPNLRSMSPPMSGSSVGSAALPGSDSAALKVLVGAPESKNAFPTSPPLSPPVSDSGGDHSILTIQPNDVGKATALGMFQKPALPYDESRFAQRQLQLQQGRETPTERMRSDSDVAQTAAPVSSLAPALKAPSATGNGDAAKTQTTFLFDDDEDDEDDDDDASPPPPALQSDAPRPQVLLQRPSDADHPAFRKSSMPTPLSSFRSTEIFTVPVPDVPEPCVTETEVTTSKNAGGPPVDSPTLGSGGGLSGMVLQHLRSTSNASSVYSTVSPHNNGFDAPPTFNGIETSITSGSLDLKIGQPWDDQNWTASVYSSISASDKKEQEPEPELPSNPPPLPPQRIAMQRPPIPEAPKNTFADVETTRAPSVHSVSSRSRITSVAGSNRSSNNLDGENEDDDFASQLANARKRVQERLTTYVESDSSRNTSPLLAPTELAPQPPPIKSNPLGILRAKSSRGSLLERSRDVSQPKSLRKLGIGSSTMSTAPSPSKQSFEDIGSSPLPTPPITGVPAVADGFSLEALQEEREEKQRRSQEDSYFRRAPASVATSATTADQSPAVASSVASAPRSSTETDINDADQESAGGDKGASGEDGNIHPGLRAFRNARRQLQKRKELETMARHQGDAPAETSAEAAFSDQPSPPRRERRPTPPSGGAPGRDRKPPPVYYQQRDPSQESRGSSNGNAGSRSRSGSRTSDQTERDRSGSEASNGGGNGRHVPPPRIRTNQGGPAYDDYQHHQPGPNPNSHLGPPSRQGMPLRSPGLPGTDIRRSPHMPPKPYPGSSGNSPSMNSLSVQTAMSGRSPSGYNPSSGQPSPISPLGSGGLPMSPYFPGSANGSGPSTPTTNGSRMQQRPGMQQYPSSGPVGYSTTSSSLNESMKKNVRKNEISEPSFLMSTSRVPTVSLPQSTSAPEVGPNGELIGSRSRSGSRARAGSNAAMAGFVPPLPPINPLRKQSGSRAPRGMMGGGGGGGGSGMMGNGRRGDGPGDEMDTMSALTMPSIPLSSSTSSTNLSAKANNYQYGIGSASDNEGHYEQRTLRKPASEASGMHSRMMGGGIPGQLTGGVSEAVAAATAAAFRNTYAKAFQLVFYTMVPFGVLALGCAWFVRDPSHLLNNHIAVHQEKGVLSGTDHRHDHGVDAAREATRP
ncbi:hypothetical protein SCUCBS95973_007201 [Sporothrix curviconia]|uniref:Uncharacterized protein n=1 Tax=Sporothrix curviconia TaxID=1260050 RepID=A0ABP0CDR8_9PEZI